MYTFTADYCTDCVECSADGQRVAVGCYQLDPDGTKTGGVYMFDQTLRNTPSSFVQTDAILDMKWRGKELLLATNSRGLTVLPNNGTEVPKYSSETTDQVHLSLDYNTEYIYSSTNHGRVNIYDHSLTLRDHINVHELETWTVCADGESVIYTGADDCAMKGWDVRSKERLFVNNRHSAGVCSIVLLDDHRIVSGSYDKELRVWDKRNIYSPLASLRVESGVWRLKRMAGCRVLAACMHDGFYVFNCSDGVVVEQHEAIPGLAYGCAIEPVSEKTAFSCCFYHKQAHEWQVNPK